MIFIGHGSLLWRAVDFAAAAGYSVDLVVVPDAAAAGNRQLPVLATADVNADADTITGASSDSIVFSINNPTILREPLLDKGLRIYNIHNGLLPRHRGLPEAAIAHAILNGDTTYGATLHEIDAGVDTGAVLDTEDFPIADADGFQDIMLQGLRACTTLFERNLDAIATGRITPRPQSTEDSGYYGRKSLGLLREQSDHPDFARATDLGIFAMYYPELAAARSV